MLDKVRAALIDYSMLENCSSITVALSGGADSMSLLYALLELKNELSLNVSAAHLNHMLRGDESLRDERFVIDACRRLGVSLVTERADVKSEAERLGISTELAARNIRYCFLERCCDGLVATAHTASDSLETVLFNLTRGTGIKGLCGIPPVRGRFVRPLIYATRADVEQYCAQRNISYVTDSTNLSDDYSRNLIRHKIIPVLKQINPSLERTVGDTSRMLTRDECFLNDTARLFYKTAFNNNRLDVSGFDTLPQAIASRVLRLFCTSQHINGIDSGHIKALYTAAVSGKTQLVLPGNVTVKVRNKTMFIDTGYAQIPHFSVELEETTLEKIKKEQKVNNLLLKNLIDCDKIIGNPVIRTRNPGDTLAPAGRGVTKSLKKLFNEEKIPAELRGILPVIADSSGVLWVYGFGVDRRAAVSHATENVYNIKAFKY